MTSILLRTLNADFNPSATKVKKRSFLKRGAGKNCLQPNAREMALAIQAKKEPKPGKRPQTAPAKNSIPPKTQTLIKPSTHKIQRAKTQNHPSKNVSKSLEFKKIETKKSLTKTVPARKTSNFQKPIEESVPSKSGIMNKEISAKKELFKKPYDEGLKTLAYRYFSQEAEDSINISIQNERQVIFQTIKKIYFFSQKMFSYEYKKFQKVTQIFDVNLDLEYIYFSPKRKQID